MHPHDDPSQKKLLGLVLWTGLAVFYATWLAAETLYRPVNPDYYTFWSAGRAANQGNYQDVYQVGQLDEYQAAPATQNGELPPAPVPYLPVFLLPYRLFSLLPLATSQWAWRVFNLAVLGAYLAFFLHKTARPARITPALSLALFSFPVFSNFIWGQSNIWLAVCVGEMMRKALQRKEFTSGLWLAGLLLKPQTLLLLLPGLALRGAWRTLAGFGVGAASLLGASLALGGTDAILEMGKLWVGFSTPIALNAPWHMVNWRMLGLHWQAVGLPFPIWIWAGMAVTTLAGLALWRKPPSAHTGGYAQLILGTLAATCAIAWHAHIHMLVVLLPALLLALVTRQLPSRAGHRWLAAFPLAGILMAATAFIASTGRPIPSFLEGTSVMALCGFGLNLCLLLWAQTKHRPGEVG